MSNTFSFNGTRKEYIKAILRGGTTPVLAPIKRQLLSVPKRPGALLQGTSTDVRTLDVPVLIEKPSGWSFPKLREDLALWLNTEDSAELKFDDDSDRLYFALLNNISNLEIINPSKAKVVITFICVDPYKYSGERRVFIQGSAMDKVFNVDNLGNIETYPITRVDVKQKLNYFSLISTDNYLQIGAPATVDEKPYEPETLILSDNCNTIGGWTQATNVDNGNISGEIKSSGNYLYADTYGTVIQPPQWQGPSLKKSLGKALKNFRARINVHFWNKPETRTGMLEVYFLNASNEVVAKIGLEDRFAATNNIMAKAGLGGPLNRQWIYSGGADNPANWDDFSGIMEIQRVNNYWTVYWSTVAPDLTHSWPRGTGGSIYYNDVAGTYADDVTQIQISFRIHPDTEKAETAIHDINVWEINDKPTPVSIPIVAMPGDVLEIDHYKNTVRKNGQIVQGLKDFGSNFFALKPGRNKLTFQPSNAGDVTLTYRERYL